MTMSNPDDAYKILKILLELTGSWPRRETSVFYEFRKVVNFVCAFVFIILILTQAAYEYTGVESISPGVFLSLESMGYLLKLVLFYHKNGELNQIFRNVQDPMLKIYDEDLDMFMKKTIRVFVLLSVSFNSMCTCTAIAIGLPPFLGEKFSRDPPFPIPINLKSLPFGFYIFFWTFQIVTLNVIAVSNLSMDILACSFMGITSAHLKILREQLKRIAYVATRNKLEGKEFFKLYAEYDNEVLNKIKKCVNYHNAIDRLVISVDYMFSASFLIQFLISLLVICLNCFMFIIYPVLSIPFMVSFLCFACLFLQFVIYCTFGNDVIVQSSKIAEACYTSEWWNCGKEVRKSLIIIMERAKRPYQFTAGKFIIISLTSLLTICKSSFSYLMVLKTFYDKSSMDILEKY